MAAGMGRRGVQWNLPGFTADGLKQFACAAMLIQNIGIAVVENGLIHLDQYTQEELSAAMETDSQLMTLAGVGSVMQIIGGLAVPIFAFLLVEGFLYTSDYRNYLLRLLGFAVISEIPYDLAISGKWMDWSSQNALVTMAVCLMMLYFLRMLGKRAEDGSGRGSRIAVVLLQLLLVLCAILWVTMLRGEFGLCMVLLTAVFYLLYDKKGLKLVLGALISLLYVSGPLAFYGIWCYTGERKERLPKYAYYVFYPLHLLVLGIVVMFLS
ncbi:MAG: conjugal transfer protein TraX [Clostridiales bacterium]|nr:conjugal transfer protein TraX [Clostridiales bacterium]